ncbi:MAG: SDR family oxidoreductase [Hyphomicrobiaceae bacterium]
MSSSPSSRRVLVLGAYGLIGSNVARRLRNEGYAVTGLGRKPEARSVLPDLNWVFHDLRALQECENWRSIIDRFDVVVNCAGALQTGGEDDLLAVHYHAIAALAAACREAGIGVVQVSAVGASGDAASAFMRSKSAGDTALRNSGAKHWIFRPGLVLAPSAYGGTVLIRMLAAVPIVQPLAFAEARICTVGVDEIAGAVVLALRDQLPDGLVCDLIEDEPNTLKGIVAAHRQWLGFAPARYELSIPPWMLWPITAAADLLGILGWKSPLRSTAISVLRGGIVGSTEAWYSAGGHRAASLSQTLARMPAGPEDRLTARLSLLTPIILTVLFAFWIVSGTIGLWRIETATQILVHAGWSREISWVSVSFWSIIDILIALALAVRSTAQRACWAMVIVCTIYLVSATLITPHLWLDPLGPLIKILPVMLLALVARSLLETR